MPPAGVLLRAHARGAPRAEHEAVRRARGSGGHRPGGRRPHFSGARLLLSLPLVSRVSAGLQLWRYTASFAITLSGPLLLTISSTHDSCCFLQHGAVQGQMLGPTLAPEQQEALMHILMALQQSGEALPPQDLDTVQVCTSHCVSPSSNIAISVPSEDTAQCHAYNLRRSCALHCMQCFTVRLCVDLTKSSGPFAW